MALAGKALKDLVEAKAGAGFWGVVRLELTFREGYVEELKVSDVTTVRDARGDE